MIKPLKIIYHLRMAEIFKKQNSLLIKHLLALVAYDEPWGTYTLGERYQKGDGITQSYENAYMCYSKIIQIGEGPLISRAQFMLGVFHLNGWYVPVNEEEAVTWFKLSAERGYPESEYNYGLSLVDGWVGEPNIKDGVIWLQKAASTGVNEAKEVLTKLGYTIPPYTLKRPEDKHYPFVLSKARDISPEACPNCGGPARWLLLSTKRNIVTMALHFLIFVIMAILAFTIDNDIFYIFVLLVVTPLILFPFRRAYKTSLHCECCGNVIKHRDIFERFRKEK